MSGYKSLSNTGTIIRNFLIIGVMSLEWKFGVTIFCCYCPFLPNLLDSEIKPGFTPEIKVNNGFRQINTPLKYGTRNELIRLIIVLVKRSGYYYLPLLPLTLTLVSLVGSPTCTCMVCVCELFA